MAKKDTPSLTKEEGQALAALMGASIHEIDMVLQKKMVRHRRDLVKAHRLLKKKFTRPYVHKAKKGTSSAAA
jgi:NH3-dependent NAD+ synthetase